MIFFKMLLKKHSTEEEQVLKVFSVMLSWGIYGASVEWRKNSKTIPPEEFIRPTIPYLMSGIDFNSNI